MRTVACDSSGRTANDDRRYKEERTCVGHVQFSDEAQERDSSVVARRAVGSVSTLSPGGAYADESLSAP